MDVFPSWKSKKKKVMRVANRYPGRPRSQGSISFVCDIDPNSGYVLKSDSSLKTLHAHKEIDGSSRRQRLMEEPPRTCCLLLSEDEQGRNLEHIKP
jgi:hypothetical protein